jgi:hypothetical protein
MRSPLRFSEESIVYTKSVTKLGDLMVPILCVSYCSFFHVFPILARDLLLSMVVIM